MKFLASDPSCPLVELSDLDNGTLPEPVNAHREALEQVVAWAKEYLCRPHPELGREGPVCPYVQASMDKQLFLLAVCPGRDFEQDEIAARLITFRDWFAEIEPRTGPESFLKTILVLFPEIPLAEVPRLIDATQEQLKPEYVKKGLMIGEFHAGPPAKPGLWNPEFRPLRCPVSMLVIRHMVSSDFAFLQGSRTFVAAYLDNYGDQVPPHLKEQVRDAAGRLGLVVDEPPLHPRVRAALQRAGITYKIHRHAEQSFPIQGPEDFALALGYSVDRITRSLLLRCQCHGKYFVVVCPVKKKLNLGRVAVLVGCKRLEVASPEELAILLGYPSQGVPPVAVGSTQVLMDEELLEHETVLAAAGEVEVEIEMAPADLRRVSRALLFSASVAIKAA